MSARILIADDVATNRIILRTRLSAAFGEVVMAESGAEALKMARDTPPDLVVLASDMRDIGGPALCQKLRADPLLQTVPVILLGHCRSREDRHSALLAGADAVLEPTPDVTVLRAWVRNLLRRRAADQDLGDTLAKVGNFGFSDTAAPGFDLPGRIAVIAPHLSQSKAMCQSLTPLIRDRVVPMGTADALADLSCSAPFDAIVICATGKPDTDALRLLSNLQCRDEARHAAILLQQGGADPHVTALALDLGVSDLVGPQCDGPELALRLRRELARKARHDRGRESLKDGLRLAATDPLTGLYNRRYALAALDRIAAESSSTGMSFAVLMLDLDRFKSINDRHGHSAGDAVLTEVARRMASGLRRDDFLARLGGEEFLAVLRCCDAAAARRGAERLRRLVGGRAIALPSGQGMVQVTTSVGLVAVGPGCTSGLDAAGLIDLADQALYCAKADGRNQVIEHADAA